MGRRLFATASVAVSVLLAGTLAGCSSPYRNHPAEGGSTSADIAQAFEVIPGVQSARASAVSWYNPGEGGLFSSGGMDLMLQLDIAPEHHIAEHQAFLDDVARAAWSLNDGYSPKGNIRVILRGGEDVDYDWQADVAAVLGEGAQFVWGPEDSRWSHDHENPPELTGHDVMVTAPVAAYEERFGGWPGAPVALDGGWLAKGAPAPIDPAAIRSLEVSTYQINNEVCARLSFQSVRNDSGEFYGGDVTVTGLLDGEKLGTRVSQVSTVAGSEVRAPDPDTTEPRFTEPMTQYGSVSFCDPNYPRRDASRYSFAVSAPAQPGFRALDAVIRG